MVNALIITIAFNNAKKMNFTLKFNISNHNGRIALISLMQLK